MTVTKYYNPATEAWEIIPGIGLSRDVADTLYPDKTDTEAAIARVDPGVAGDDTQTLGWNSGAPVLLRFREVDPTHPRWGAVGTGNDADADENADIINAAALSLASANKGVLSLPPGDFRVNPKAMPGYPGYYGCIQIPSGIWMMGAGIGATILKLPATLTDADFAVIRNTNLAGGDASITISDLTIDGNGGVNGDDDYLPQGISITRARGVRIERVRAQDIHGYEAFPPGETFHINLTNCVDVVLSSCEAVGTAGDHGTGFGDNACTNVAYQDCTTWGMGSGMGFASWHGRNIRFVGCAAYLNGTHGINLEFGADILLSACTAGGLASDMADGYFYADDADLGNGADGIVINATQRAIVAGCHSSHNGGNGINVVPTGGYESSVQIIGGTYRDNTHHGVRFGSSASAATSRISRETDIGSNGTNDYYEPVLGSQSVGGILTPPTMPASGVELANPYPFACQVYVAGTVDWIGINGAYLDIGGGGVRHLAPGQTIEVNYSGATPTWVWVRA